jgi:hypothetical protein
MSRSGPPLPPETEALLAREREIAPLPPSVRERVMARARASLRSRSVAPPMILRAPTRSRWAIAAGLLCVASAAMGAAAYEIRVHWPTAPRVAPSPPARPKVVVPASPPPAVPAVEEPAPPAPETEHLAPAPRAAKQPVPIDELRLLRRARAAVAARDFGGALPPLVEHARRFKDGRLAEEREALRVKALAGLGHADEARRAAGQFEARFPRSVLLPAVKRMANPER